MKTLETDNPPKKTPNYILPCIARTVLAYHKTFRPPLSSNEQWTRIGQQIQKERLLEKRGIEKGRINNNIPLDLILPVPPFSDLRTCYETDAARLINCRSLRESKLLANHLVVELQREVRSFIVYFNNSGRYGWYVIECEGFSVYLGSFLANVKGDSRLSENQASSAAETPDTPTNSASGKSSSPPSC